MKENIVFTKECYAIAVAMDLEAKPFYEVSTKIKETTLGYTKIMEMEYQGLSYLLVISGIGKAFSAAAVSALYSYDPLIKGLINVGVAGSINPQKAPLFAPVIASSLVEHDLDTSAIGDPKGLVSGINRVNLPVDEAIKNGLIASTIDENMKPVIGVISSGDTFFADKINKERIYREFSSLATDMEAASFAQIAFVYKIRFGALRLISDANNAAVEYQSNAQKSAKLACQIALRFISNN